MNTIRWTKWSWVWLAIALVVAPACGIYTFKDVSIPAEIKTVKVNFIENKARLVNPRLSPALTDKLQQKIVSQTKLIRTNNEDADWVISGAISDYSISTSGLSAQQASTNRLTVVVQISLRDNKINKTTEYSVNKSFDFSASKTLQQAESELGDELIRGVTDEIFNRLFSNW
ncbi:LptE family protein [Phnomibacter sp. MR]|uniref:LptE family protein n=1 Tax=Phnomibacter sp. MR TaxID=3042318 RepID=UPI003A80BE2C